MENKIAGADLCVRPSEAGRLPALQLNQKEFLQAFSPVKCVKAFQADIIPLDCARRSDVPTLTDIKNKYGEDYLTGFVCLWITEILDYYGKKYPTENVIKTCASDCLKGRMYLNIADINLIFGDIRRTASDINMPRIVKAFEDYCAERAASYYEKRLREDDVLKKHGYAKKPIPESDFSGKLANAVIERQMEQAKKDADLELLKLNQDYQLHEVLKKIKRNEQLAMDN